MHNKKLLIGTNTKMYKNIADTISYISQLSTLTDDIRDKLTLFVIPSFTTLDRINQHRQQYNMLLGAQNMNWEQQGQYTGEVSPLMLKEVGVDIVEIGHSERRHILHETNDEVSKKVKSALENDFTALLCIGEQAYEKELGLTEEILSIQIKTALANIPKNKLTKLWIAYEPVWAIGVNGKPATAEYVEYCHQFIRDLLVTLYGNIGNDIPLLYGGSVNSQNAPEFIIKENIDGLFVGRSAWNAEKFNELIRICLPLI